MKDERGVVVDDRCNFHDIISVWFTSFDVSSLVVLMGVACAFTVARNPCIGLHCVAWSAFAKSFPRHRLLDPASPSKRVLARLARLCPVTSLVPILRRTAPYAPKILAKMVDPILVIKWLRVSRLVRHYKTVAKCVELGAELFSLHGVTAEELKGSLRKVCPELIRLGRIRLDIVCMMLHRLWIASLMDKDADVYIYLYIDGSPTWRGVEQFCATYELFDGENWHRRLFPVVALDQERMDGFGKCITLLWQIWLIAGPSFSQMRWFLSKVFGIITDMGTERVVPFMKDFLPVFSTISTRDSMRQPSKRPNLFSRMACIAQGGVIYGTSFCGKHWPV